MGLTKLIEKLAAFKPSETPFISIYLNAEANSQGRDGFQTWLKNEFRENSNQFETETEQARLFAKAEEQINYLLENEVDEVANGIAVFASLDGDFFETAQLDEPFPNNRFLMFTRPHIFPLVRMVEQNPKYIALWADTNKADIYIFGGENTLNSESETKAKVEAIQNEKTNRTQVGGWSQARYQRHVENYHLHHAKETVEEVEKLMREQKIEHLILCGDETGVIPILKEQFSKAAEEKLVSTLNLSQYASEEEIRQQTSKAMKIENAVRDQEKVERMFNAAKAAAGLGTIGVEKTLAALSNGQVEELIISSTFEAIKYNTKAVEKVLENYASGDSDLTSDELSKAAEKRRIGDELLIRALNSAAKICFIEDESLLKNAGGAGAVLRYNMNATANS